MLALLTGPLVVLAMVLMLVTLPVTAPVSIVLAGWQRRRLRAVADRTCCGRCGHVLGRAALQAADAAHIVELGALHKQHPNGMVDLMRRSDARCTGCGATYAWDRRLSLLRPLEDGTSPEE